MSCLPSHNHNSCDCHRQGSSPRAEGEGAPRVLKASRGRGGGRRVPVGELRWHCVLGLRAAGDCNTGLPALPPKGHGDTRLRASLACTPPVGSSSVCSVGVHLGSLVGLLVVLLLLPPMLFRSSMLAPPVRLCPVDPSLPLLPVIPVLQAIRLLVQCLRRVPGSPGHTVLVPCLDPSIDSGGCPYDSRPGAFCCCPSVA